MKILIVAGTGTVGSRVTQLLAQSPGFDVTIATRTPEKQISSKIKSVAMDFRNPESIQAALKGQNKVVLITPASQTEGEDGVRFVELAQKSGIRHIVFQSIHDVRKASAIPHFESKIRIQNALEKSGLLWTSICPNNFYQNDYWFQQAVMEYGVYPQPFGNKGLSRVDADDIAFAIANAISDETLALQEYPLVGPEALTAQQTAEAFSQALGKKIVYIGDDLDAWEQEALKTIPPWLVSDWKQMYGFFQSHGLRASAQDLLNQAKILGRAPKSFGTFAQETAQIWKK